MCVLARARMCTQAGSDADRLDQGLQFLRQLLDEEAGPAAAAAAAAQDDVRQPASMQAKSAEQQEALPLLPREEQHEQAAAPTKRARRQQAGQQADVSAGIGGADTGPRPGCASRPAVYGSLLLPSKKLLAQMRFRPWGGVFLRWAGCLNFTTRMLDRAGHHAAAWAPVAGRLHPHFVAALLPPYQREHPLTLPPLPPPHTHTNTAMTT